MDLEAAAISGKVTKEEFAAQVPELRVELLNAQFDLGQRGDFAMVVLLAGDDRIGRNEVLNRLNEWLDARQMDVAALDAPSDEERERPPFWRYWRQMPARGRIGVFFGGWAMTAVGERLLGQLGEKAFERRLEHIQSLERALADDGALVLKLWLHLSKKKHEKRLAKADREPDDEWRVSEADRRISELYDESLPVVERLMARTDEAHAPWIVIDGGNARHRDLTVGRAIRDALKNRLEAPAAPPAVVKPGVETGRGALAELDLSAALDEASYDERLGRLQARLGELSERARRKGRTSVLVFEGWDAAGKGGTIRRITAAMDARDYRVVPIAAPSEEERAHHYLWRFWRHLPRAGHTLIFDRSWYGRVLVERVEGFAREDEWRRAYAEVVDFEAQLVEHGYLLRKFWLHIDQKEQLRRFEAREKTPYKKYKIGDEDYRNRERWDAYVQAVDEMVARTSRPDAPWILLAANDKKSARIKVLEELCAGLEAAL